MFADDTSLFAKVKDSSLMLINANVIARHNAIVISCDEQMQISNFSLFKHFPIKVNDVTIKIIKIQELSSSKVE